MTKNKRDVVVKEVKETHDTTSAGDRAKLEAAIKAVYKRYGTNLPAFFRDAYVKAARKHQEPTDKSVEAFPL